MTALLGFILSNPTIIAIFAGVIGIVAALFKGRIDGAAKERNANAKKELDA